MPNYVWFSFGVTVGVVVSVFAFVWALLPPKK